MNNTSPGSRLDNTAAKSPPFSIAGPLLVFKSTPNSFAIICASVVLPNPGGPYNKTWSNGSSRILAASINIRIFSFTSSWPTYSFKDWGLISFSKSASFFISAVTILSSIVVYPFF